MVTRNPLFDGLDESTDVERFLRALGFDVRFEIASYEDLPDPEEDGVDWVKVHDEWNPEPPEGYEIGLTYENEHYGLIACFLRPQTDFAKAVWGLSKEMTPVPA